MEMSKSPWISKNRNFSGAMMLLCAASNALGQMAASAATYDGTLLAAMLQKPGSKPSTPKGRTTAKAGAAKAAAKAATTKTGAAKNVRPAHHAPLTSLVTGNGFGFATLSPTTGAVTGYWAHPYKYERPHPQYKHATQNEVPD